MFDFNHGASKSAEDIRAMPFSERVNSLIDAGVTQKASEIDDKNERPYIGASSIGSDCLRSVQLQYLKETQPDFPHKPAQFTSKLLKIFNNGHRIEPMVAEWMRCGGFKMKTEKTDGSQYGFSIPDINFKGHFDGIITESPFPMALDALWECKGMKGSVWKKFKKNGVKLESPNYYAQIQVNQQHSGMKRPCVFTVYNKDTSELHHELVDHVPHHAERVTQNATIVYQSTEMGRMIRRPYSDPNNFKCRDCVWKKACWSMKK